MNDGPQRLTAALADRYRIERELGQGGMATVYLAEDIKHRRRVAIKVLHPELSAVLGTDRFLKEIELTAGLQHPHILPLFDSGAVEGLLYYVMPFVEGETLRSRLSREHQLPVPEAVRIATDVADALEYAHKRGVIHRDIKPENILLHEGRPQVADFGIALAVQQAGGSRMTQTGLSLGTPQYMAPEQAMGDRGVDARADVYALGAVTYEMLTGEPPFTGPTPQSIVAKVMTEAPRPITAQRRTVPAEVEAAVLAALEKLPADRFGTAKEFAEALNGKSVGRYVGKEKRGFSTALPPYRPTVLAVALLVPALLVAGWLIGRRARPIANHAATSTRFALEARPGEHVPIVIAKIFTVSPDGSTLVYVASLNGGPTQLVSRRFDELESKPISGTSGAVDPVFSPDGKWLAFFSGAQLSKVPLEGGTPIRLAPVPGSSSRGIAWTEKGEIVFATNSATTLFAVSAEGGAVRTVFESGGGGGLRWPVAIHGTHEVLYSLFTPTGDTVQVFAGSLDDGKSSLVHPDAYTGLGLLDGKLLYLTRTGEVMAAPFDRKRRVATGPGLRVASGVWMSTGTGLGIATLSASGDLVFRDGTSASQLVMVSPDGRERPVIPDTLGYENPRFSPDGRRIAVSVVKFNRKAIYLLDRGSSILSRLTDEEAGTTRDRPEWTPDGKQLIYRVNAPTGNGLVLRAADRSDSERRAPAPIVSVNEMVVHPDGRTVIARVSAGAARSQDIWWWTLSDTTPHHYTETGDFETGARFSPDGRFVAYAAETGGSREVYVSPFPGPGARVQVSRDGGGPPVWGPDSRTLYYPQGSRLMAATLSVAPSVTVTGFRTVLDGSYAFEDALHATFDVGRDGTILLVRPVREARTVVIRNFRAEITNQLARQGAK